MDFKKYLERHQTQKKINRLAKLYKNKKIAVYGAGQFSQVIFENYDLSKLNIVAVADIKFEKNKEAKFFNYNCIAPKDLGVLDCDVILVANYDYNVSLIRLDDHILYLTKNENIEVRPLIKLTFKDYF